MFFVPATFFTSPEIRARPDARSTGSSDVVVAGVHGRSDHPSQVGSGTVGVAVAAVAVRFGRLGRRPPADTNRAATNARTVRSSPQKQAAFTFRLYRAQSRATALDGENFGNDIKTSEGGLRAEQDGPIRA
jgi:hypothetical protein